MFNRSRNFWVSVALVGASALACKPRPKDASGLKGHALGSIDTKELYAILTDEPKGLREPYYLRDMCLFLTDDSPQRMPNKNIRVTYLPLLEDIVTRMQDSGRTVPDNVLKVYAITKKVMRFNRYFKFGHTVRDVAYLEHVREVLTPVVQSFVPNELLVALANFDEHEVQKQVAKIQAQTGKRPAAEAQFASYIGTASGLPGTERGRILVLLPTDRGFLFLNVGSPTYEAITSFREIAGARNIGVIYVDLTGRKSYFMDAFAKPNTAVGDAALIMPTESPLTNACSNCHSGNRPHPIPESGAVGNSEAINRIITTMPQTLYDRPFDDPEIGSDIEYSFDETQPWPDVKYFELVIDPASAISLSVSELAKVSSQEAGKSREQILEATHCSACHGQDRGPIHAFSANATGPGRFISGEMPPDSQLPKRLRLYANHLLKAKMCQDFHDRYLLPLTQKAPPPH